MVVKAFFLALKAHKGQTDKGGRRYIFHPLTVASKVKGKKEKTVALLHDVVEDSDYTLDDLRQRGFSQDVVEALSLMTHQEGVPYFDYVRKIKDNELARTVKLADLEHNSDVSRLKEISQKDKDRLAKYQEARRILEE